MTDIIFFPIIIIAAIVIGTVWIIMLGDDD